MIIPRNSNVYALGSHCLEQAHVLLALRTVLLGGVHGLLPDHETGHLEVISSLTRILQHFLLALPLLLVENIDTGFGSTD